MFTNRKIIKLFYDNILLNRYNKLLLSNLNKVAFRGTQILLAYKHDVSIKIVSLDKPIASLSNRYTYRTHTCGELKKENVGEHVQLCGWLEYQRVPQFLILRDSYGSTQVIIPKERKDLTEIAEGILYESVLSIRGKVVLRPKDQINTTMKTGEIEIIAESIDILNTASKDLPFVIRSHNKAKESTQMKYRYLSLRYPEVQKNLRLRSSVIAKMREFLINECNFVDVETPTLFKRTPGGAQEFIVPTRHPGKFYSLVQSPQQFKQILMVGGIDRYFQVARCYRDETARHDRQPEFTQLDIEMSFTDREGILELIENLLAYCWPKELGEIKTPFNRMLFNEVMELYGIDQPDLRIPYQLQNITNYLSNRNNKDQNYGFYALVFPKKQENFTSSVKNQLLTIKNNYFPSIKFAQMKYSANLLNKIILSIYPDADVDFIIKSLNLEDGDVVLLSWGDKNLVRKLLGKLRLEFTNILEQQGNQIRSPGFQFTWIIDFPLFSEGDTEGTFDATHHPFTMPHPDDMKYLYTDPLKVRGLHYDLVLNGSEIGGGSIRIHDVELQKHILNKLGIETEQLSHMLDALSSGAPPHGGIALGLDRLLAILCNVMSIRNVIAFPKTVEGQDLMSGAPTIISDAQKILYHLK
ncbi:aspartate--tRNA ligase, mitochondrial [Prorops nasuta]|uniref:aspartate--tRNA ligase, mitochondrial n=1 Tax=Prorops nasuta TaxID=863751 RepID=UPI0034CF02BB